MLNMLCLCLQKCSSVPAELHGVWQMRVNGLESTFLLVYLDVRDYSEHELLSVPSGQF